jgi:hypothetical protein
MSTVDLSKLPASKLLAKQTKASEVASALCSEFIAAGRGYEKSSETALKTDPLALRWLANAREEAAIQVEIDRRKEWHGSLRPIKPRPV